MNIKSKFIIVFLAISIIPLLLLGQIHYSNAKKELEANTKELLVYEAGLIVDMVNFLDNRVKSGDISLSDAEQQILQFLSENQNKTEIKNNKEIAPYIFTEDNKLLVPGNSIEQHTVESIVKLAKQSGNGFTTFNSDNAPYISYYIYDNTWNWTIVVSISLETLNSISAKIFWTTLISMIGFIIIEVLAVFILTDRISKPILELNKSMLNVAAGRLSIPSLDINRTDEIGKINRTHVDMVTALSKLISELKGEIDKGEMKENVTLDDHQDIEDGLSKQISRVRRHTKERLRIADNIFNSISEAILVTDYNGKIQYVNPAFTEVTGYNEDDVIGETPALLNSGRHKEDFYKRMWNSLYKYGKWKGEIWNKRKNGQVYPEWLSINSFSDEEERITHFVAIFSDITERKQHEEMLRLYARMFESSSEGIMITDMNSYIIDVNPAFEETTGYLKKEVIGKRPTVLQSGKHDMPFYINMWAEIHENGKWRGEIWNKRKNGEIFPEWLTVNAVRDEEGNLINYVGIFTDITERKRAEEKLTHLAHYDVLTKLPNRHLFHQRLNKALSESLVRENKVALLFLDLDRFKMTNDTLGHTVGDQLLFEVAQRLRKCIRDGDTISRLGGDEFTIILNNINKLRDIIIVVNRIFDSFRSPFDIMGHEIFISTSIGISLYPTDADNREELIKNADTAMYRAKEDKGNNYVFFNMDMNKSLSAKMKLENALRKAIQNNDFELHYQPQIDVKTKEVTGAEALIRWRHPEMGPISPAEFIPVAEETGLIIPIGEWVLKQASNQVKEWLEKGKSPFKMSVNISAHQFKNNKLVEMIKRVLDETKIPASSLNIEITETVSMYNYDVIISVLNGIKDLGVDLSIDDFGKGHSSLSYLKEFPVDYLKVDRSFITNLESNPENQAIVHSVIKMAQGLKMKVVAEGVETKKEASILQDFECDYFQGYYYGKPVPAKEFEDKFLNAKLNLVDKEC